MACSRPRARPSKARRLMPNARDARRREHRADTRGEVFVTRCNRAPTITRKCAGCVPGRWSGSAKRRRRRRTRSRCCRRPTAPSVSRDKRYDSIGSDPAHGRMHRARRSIAGPLSIEPFGPSRWRVRRTRPVSYVHSIVRVPVVGPTSSRARCDQDRRGAAAVYRGDTRDGRSRWLEETSGARAYERACERMADAGAVYEVSWQTVARSASSASCRAVRRSTMRMGAPQRGHGHDGRGVTSGSSGGVGATARACRH